MIDRILCGFMFLLFIGEGCMIIHNKLVLTRYEQRQELILEEINELKKKARLNAQDIQFLETLVIKGGINEK